MSLPCCGLIREGPDAIRCGDDGFCYKGNLDVPCLSAMDDPLCNIPGAAAEEDDQADDQLSKMQFCRQDAIKLQALHSSELYGGGPLHHAVLFGRLESIEMLLEEGADVNVRGFGGATPLHMAAVLPQSARTLPLLLQAGAEVNATDDFGFTPLHRFVQANNVEAVTLLLSHGANVALVAPGNETPLHLASYENSQLMAELLLAFVSLFSELKALEASGLKVLFFQ